MDLYLVRHGLSVGNQARRLQGWTDNGLTAQGQAQAEATGRWLAAYLAGRGAAVAGLYSSDIGRAWDTALALGRHLGATPIAEPGLREMHFGVVENTLATEWQAYADLLPQWRDRSNLDFGWPGGETRRQLRARVTAAIDAIVARHQPGDQVIAVTHGGPIRAYLATVARHPSLADADLTRDQGNCSITHVHFAVEGDGLGVGCLLAHDQVAHLREAE